MFPYSPGARPTQTDTAVLIDSMAREDLRPGRRVLDLGSGSGAVAVKAAIRGAAVTAVGMSRSALALAFVAGLLHGHRIDVRYGELFTPVRGRRFDLIVANRLSLLAPPYGSGAVDRLCAGCPAALARHGVLLVVQSSLSDIARTCRMLRQAGLRTSVAASTAHPSGAPARERLVVVRGVRP